MLFVALTRSSIPQCPRNWVRSQPLGGFSPGTFLTEVAGSSWSGHLVEQTKFWNDSKLFTFDADPCTIEDPFWILDLFYPRYVARSKTFFRDLPDARQLHVMD